MKTERNTAKLEAASLPADASNPAVADTAPDQLPRSVFSPEVARARERLFNAAVAKSTAGLDPRAILLAFLVAPGSQLVMGTSAAESTVIGPPV